MDRQPSIVVLALGECGLGLRDQGTMIPVISLRFHPSSCLAVRFQRDLHSGGTGPLKL